MSPKQRHHYQNIQRANLCPLASCVNPRIQYPHSVPAAEKGITVPKTQEVPPWSYKDRRSRGRPEVPSGSVAYRDQVGNAIQPTEQPQAVTGNMDVYGHRLLPPLLELPYVVWEAAPLHHQYRCHPIQDAKRPFSFLEIIYIFTITIFFLLFFTTMVTARRTKATADRAPVPGSLIRCVVISAVVSPGDAPLDRPDPSPLKRSTQTGSRRFPESS